MKKWYASIVFCMLVMASSFVFSATEVAPDEIVKSTTGEVLTTIKGDKSLQSGDYKKIHALIEEKILPKFDFERVCRLVLGKNYRTATPEQRETFQKEFKTLLVHTYAVILSEYRGQEITYKPFRMEAGANKAEVGTQILQAGGPPVNVSYSLNKTATGWKIYDVVIENVSQVINYHNQFGEEIRQNGLDSLNQKIAAKNQAPQQQP